CAGAAILTKSYLGLLLIALATVMTLLRQTRVRQLICLIVAALAVAGPWLALEAIQHPREFGDAYWTMLMHTDQGVEGFGAPWDRLWFDYAANVFYLFYVTALAAGAWAIHRQRSGRRVDLSLALPLAWAILVFLVMTFTANKAPSATAIGWPAVFLLLGLLIARAWRGDRLAMSIWLAAMVAAFVYHGHFIAGSMGVDSSGQLLAIARSQLWIVWELAAALFGGGVLAAYAGPRSMKIFGAVATVLAATLFLAPVLLDHHRSYCAEALAVTELDRESPEIVQIGRFAETLPSNAVFLLQERSKFERNALMFYSDRTVYPLDQQNWRQTASRISAASGTPFIISDRSIEGEKLFSASAGTRSVFKPAS
ncbi:MAG: hypothetical protein JO353_07550, partial [Phycisphaerae bacterium]|nr:hypothetical protein [Phycisphaerae bacterium]